MPRPSANAAQATEGAVEGGNLQRIVKTSLYLFFETFVGIETWLFK